MKTIHFFSEQTTFTPNNKTQIREWLTHIIRKHKKTIGEINIIFCNDDYLLKLNEQYLGHDTYTDIITFDFVEGKIINGDIFISVDQMRENAKLFHVAQSSEMRRLIVHGVLHLLGYKDGTAKDRKIMTAQEEAALSVFDKTHKR